MARLRDSQTRGKVKRVLGDHGAKGDMNKGDREDGQLKEQPKQGQNTHIRIHDMAIRKQEELDQAVDSREKVQKTSSEMRHGA